MDNDCLLGWTDLDVPQDISKHEMASGTWWRHAGRLAS